MDLRIVIFACSSLTIAAYPYHYLQNGDVASREQLWNSQDQKANQVADKSHITDITVNHFNQMWKTHPEHRDTYDQESDARSRLGPNADPLRARLLRELNELREKLLPYTAPRQQQGLAHLRARLAPFTQQLQGALNRNSHELCGQLSFYLQSLETVEGPGPAAQEAGQWMSQTLESNSQKAVSYLEEFKAQTSSVMAELETSEEGQNLQEVATRLGQEVETFSAGLQSRAATLYDQLAGLSISSQPLNEAISTDMAQFCHSSQQFYQEFFTQIELQLEGQGWSTAPSLQHSGFKSLGEDFSTKLRTLLQDIIQSLD